MTPHDRRTHADGTEPPRARSCWSSRAALSPARRVLNTVAPLARAVDLPGAGRGHGRGHGQERRASSSAPTAGATCCSTPSILLLLAVGQAVVIITRNVDLSVGSVLALTAYLTGRLFIDQPGLPIVAVFAVGILAGAVARPGQRRAGRLRQGARRWSSRSARSTSTAASCSPGPAATGSTPATCRATSWRWAPRRSSTIPVLTIIALVVLGVGRLLPLHRPRRPRALRDRLRPRRRRALRPATYAAGCSPPSSSAAPWPAWPASSTPPATAPSAPAPAPASSCRRSPPWSSAASRSSAAAAPCGARRIGAFLLVTINRALPILGIQDFWQRAVVGVLILGAIVLDRVLAIRQARKLAEARELTA